MLVKQIANECHLPYYEDKESDYRNAPDSCHKFLEGIEKVKNPIGIYYHKPTMCLVILTSNEKIGLKSNSMEFQISLEKALQRLSLECKELWNIV